MGYLVSVFIYIHVYGSGQPYSFPHTLSPPFGVCLLLDPRAGSGGFDCEAQCSQ
jgi:hypothetical protein